MTTRDQHPDAARFRIDPDSRPYSHLRFKNDPDEFQFGVLADNSGGPRPGVVAAGLRMLDLLQPEFVVNLGDLIVGYSKPEDHTPATDETYRAWWEEWDGYLEGLESPFFYVAGNHDINNPASLQVWRERYGGTRQYTHFRYKDTLFLLLSTEDPPKDTDQLLEEDPETAKMLGEAYEAVKRAAASGADVAELLELARPVEEYFGTVNISDAQVEYFRQVLADNADVRWTFVLMHAPAWPSSNGDPDPGNFAHIEEALSDRDYTVFAAHTHTYDYTERHGRDYITTAMTGAVNVPRLGAIDHVVWVTMTDDGPKIANLMLNGILDKHGPVDGDHTIEFGMYRRRDTD